MRVLATLFLFSIFSGSGFKETSFTGNRGGIQTIGAFLSMQNRTVIMDRTGFSKNVIKGSGNIDIEKVTDETLTLIISGSGDITAKGKVKNLIGTIEGAGDLDVAELKAETAVITIEGAGDADVHVTKALTAEICGSGEITYSGLPTEVNASVTGAGEVIKK